MTTPPSFLHILTVLAEHDVEYIVVGGVSAVLHGAPITTFDLDIVHERSEKNVDRLHMVLTHLEAHYRGQFGRRILPQKAGLRGPGHHLFLTAAGPLDVLGTIGDALSFAELTSHTTSLPLGEGLHTRLLDLETLIEIKETLGFEKDLAMLPILRRTLQERKARQDRGQRKSGE